MKILHLTNFYHEHSGGIKTYLDAKARYFREHGIPVYHVLPGPRDEIQHPDENTIIYRIAAPTAPVNDSYRIIWNLAAVTAVIRREKPDIIEINDKYSLLYAPFFARVLGQKFKTVGFIHDRLDDTLNLYWEPPWFAHLTARVMMRIITACYDRIITASQFVADELVPYADHKVDVINLGVDTERFTPDYHDPELHKQLCPDGEAMLLYAGRLAKEKNVTLLPGVMKKLRQQGIPARLVVVGNGPEEDAIRQIPENQRAFCGYVTDEEEMCRLMASADALLFPSLREPFGLVPLEALACGCPVVCVNQGGTLEYNNSPAVKSVEGTADAFAASIVDFLKSDHGKLRKVARTHARTFSWDSTFDKQVALYRSLLS